MTVINSHWLQEMVSQAVRSEIGTVGARLYYADETVQHAGIFLGYRGLAGHVYRYAPRHSMGDWARLVLVQNFTAVTAACMIVRRDVFEEVGGFDEERLTITFNDVDLCLRISEKGYRNLYTPFAELYHFESKTRGLLALQEEEDYFAAQWKKVIDADPAYNPNLTVDSESLTPAFPPRLRHPWIPTPNASGSPLVTHYHKDSPGATGVFARVDKVRCCTNISSDSIGYCGRWRMCQPKFLRDKWRVSVE